MGHIRFLVMSVVLMAAIAAFAAGGLWMAAPFVVQGGLVVVLDAVVGDDASALASPLPVLLHALLFATLPLLLLMHLTLWWMAGSGDPLHSGAWVLHHLGWDPFAARAVTRPWHWLLAILGAGLMTASGGTNVGHELTHRTRSPFSMGWGRWLLAFSADASFSIEHVHGHHARLCTLEDPASARRGETVFWFILRSTCTQWISAWKLEAARLSRKGFAVLGWRNRFFRGVLMSAVLAGLAYAVGGARAVLLFLLVAATAKAILEAINFVEHYGLVRVPGSKVEPRHSWNSNAAMSGWILYNLVRHSDHHAEGSKPFWRLRALPDAPMLPYGYMTMLLIAFAPPLFRRLMVPRLRDWDARHANGPERALARDAGANSGWRELVEA